MSRALRILLPLLLLIAGAAARPADAQPRPEPPRRPPPSNVVQPAGIPFAPNDGGARVESLLSAAAALRLHGDFAASVPLLQEAVALAEGLSGPGSGAAARPLGKLAEARILTGDLDGGEADALRQLQILRATLPVHDPGPADALGTLGLVQVLRGDLDRADSLFRAALELRVRALGPEHPDVAQMLNNVALVHLSRQEYGRALPLLQEAGAIYDRTPPADSDDARALTRNLADVLAGLGEYARADSAYADVTADIQHHNGPAHPALANALLARAMVRLISGRADSVESWATRALAIHRTRPAQEQPDVAGAYAVLGTLYQQRGELARADSALREGLRTIEAARGPDDPQAGSLLNQLSSVQVRRRDLAGAEVSLLRAARIMEAAYGADNLNLGIVLSNLANVASSRGSYARADSLLARAEQIHVQALGADHPALLTPVLNRAILQERLADLAGAEATARRALDIARRAFGPDHPRTVDVLEVMASIRLARGDYPAADSLLRRVVAIRSTAEGASPVDLAQALNNLGSLASDAGQLARADSLLNQARDRYQAVLGPAHPSVAGVLENLATLAGRRGDYAAADSLFHQALDLQERALGPEHPRVAGTLSNLAVLYQDRGDYARSEPLLRRALDIRLHALGPAHPDAGAAMINLAVAARARNDDAAAETLLVAAAGIFRDALGPRSEGYATALSSLGGLYVHRGEAARGLDLLREGARLHAGARGPAHPATTTALNNVAVALRVLGRLDEAEAVLREVVSTEERTLGEHHPDFPASVGNLGQVLYAAGRTDEAMRVLWRAEEAREGAMQSVLALGSEAQKTSYLRAFAGDVNTALSVDADQGSAPSARLALTVALRRKGRALDVASGQVQRLRRGLDPAGLALLDSLAQVRGAMSRLASSGGEGARAALDSLAARADALEQAVGRRGAAFRAEAAPATVEAVQASLPPGSALVEIVLFQPLDLRAPGADLSSGGPRYRAYVLRHGVPLRSADLGPAAGVDSAVARLRDVLGTPFSPDAAEAARALDARVMGPVRPLLGDEETLFLSPDGPLNLVPFAALVDERGAALLDRWTLVYLTSGRELPRLAAAGAHAPEPAVVVGDPEYGAADAGRWRRLAATGAEAVAVARHLPGARTLLRGQATEARVKAVAHPRVLHLATHGFVDGGDRTDGDAADILLHAGLALAGANQGGGDGEDGVLTALEVAGLDLDGTALVVLSACETAGGVATGGEGAYGLRRSLVLAGARAQVMSLWQVDDQATRELMEDFYAGLTAGRGAPRALRDAQRQARAAHPHPYYWAAFLAAGDAAPLFTDGVP
jgi:CHAT domain-containing protein/tetratricopeptide (TPR) repeat protein